MARNIDENRPLPEEADGVPHHPKPYPEEELTQTISVKPPSPNIPRTGVEIAKRTALLAAISAGIAALIKKTIQPALIRLQPQDFPLRVPDEAGFFTGGVLGATGLMLIQKKYRNRRVSRRDFFPIVGAGIGAVIGHLAAKNEQEVPAPLHAEPDESGKL